MRDNVWRPLEENSVFYGNRIATPLELFVLRVLTSQNMPRRLSRIFSHPFSTSLPHLFSLRYHLSLSFPF